MGCADYRLYCDGDSDGDGNDLMHGVLDKEKRSGVWFQDALLLVDRITILHSLTLPLSERMRSFHSEKKSGNFLEIEKNFLSLHRRSEQTTFKRQEKKKMFNI